MSNSRSFQDISCKNDKLENATLSISDDKLLATFANIANAKVV